ncbi:glycine cleavage T-protein family [Wolffia australiana]
MEVSPAACFSRIGTWRRSVDAAVRRRHGLRSAFSGEFCWIATPSPCNRTVRSTIAIAASSSASFDLSPPPIDYDEEDFTVRQTPPASKDFSATALGSFADDNMAIDAAYNGVAVVDLTHFGRLRVSGDDRIQFLHNQTTANFQALSEGQGCDTVLVTSTARTIDIAHAWVMKNAIVLTVSPTTRKTIADMLARYIFFADKVEINDITEKTSFFALIGPKSVQVMEALTLQDAVGQPYGTHYHYTVNGAPVTVGVGSLLSKEGFCLLTSPESAEPIWRALLRQGAIPMGPTAWERLRILNGRPAPEKELTNDYNVLEAGLWMTISLDKGCYKGQETISRLITYDGVKQRLWALRLAGPAEPGSPITVNGQTVGVLTSYAVGREGGGEEHVGLGYIKRKAAASAGLAVTVSGVTATLNSAPFLSHSLERK